MRVAEAAGVEAAGAMDGRELSLWAAHLDQRRREEEIRQDMRIEGLVFAMRWLKAGAPGEPDLKNFLPALAERKRELTEASGDQAMLDMARVYAGV